MVTDPPNSESSRQGSGNETSKLVTEKSEESVLSQEWPTNILYSDCSMCLSHVEAGHQPPTTSNYSSSLQELTGLGIPNFSLAKQ